MTTSAGAEERWNKPEVAKVAGQGMAKRFLAEHLLPLLRNVATLGGGGRDLLVETEEVFWQQVSTEMFSVIRLNGFTVTDWFPRIPGKFWLPNAIRWRNAMQERVEIRSDPVLGNFMNPSGKRDFVQMGGFGTVRLSPKTLNGKRHWFATAFKSSSCDAGIPLAIPDDLLFESSFRWGQQVNIVGRLHFLRDTGLRWLSRFTVGISPVILVVESLRPSRSRVSRDVLIRPTVLFEHRPYSFDYVFVTCRANCDYDIQHACEWISLYAERFNGRVVTNFDEQLPRFANAPLSYQRLVTGSYERRFVTRYLTRTTVNHIDKMNVKELHMDNVYRVGGDAIFNIDSVLKNVTQTIGSSRNLNADQKAELERLSEQLKNALQPIRVSHSEESQVILDSFQNAAAQAAKPPEQRKKNLLKVSADGLISAAKTVADIAPAVLSTASLIAKFLMGLS